MHQFNVFLLEVLNPLDELLLDLAGESGHLVLEFVQRRCCLFGSLELVNNVLAFASILEVDLNLQPNCYFAAGFHPDYLIEGYRLTQRKLNVLEQLRWCFYVITMILDIFLLDLLCSHPEEVRVVIVPILHRHLEDLAGIDPQFDAIIPRGSLQLCPFESFILHIYFQF